MNTKNVLAIALLLAVVFSAGVVSWQFTDQNGRNGSSNNTGIATVTTTVTITAGVVNGDLSPVDLFKKVESSVVAITVTLAAGGSAQGSGFVYNDQGNIVTNNHVIDGATDITVTFLNGESVKAELVGKDAYADLAVIKVDLRSQALKSISLGNSSSLQIGETVVAIGNPFGLSGSMSLGIVSQLGRSSTEQGFPMIDLIQTDAAVNPGNSGGPLLNMKGEVIGINTMIFSNAGGNEGVGLAIPSNTISRVVDSLIRSGVYRHAYVGIQGIDVTPGIANAMGLSESKGFLILQITQGTAAERAGLRGGNKQVTIDGYPVNIGGDVIVGIDNIEVRKLSDMLLYTERFKQPGDTIALKIIRDGATTSVNVTLGERPPLA
ncbi:MAG TPA: trypsin-like peptidase domain-containing protein [Nitrososphaerales archaeon]